MNAKRDENRVTTLIGALNTDGKTQTLAYANPVTHRFLLNIGTTGSDFGVKNAVRDENRVPVALGVSSSNGKTSVEAYVDNQGKLLVEI